MPDEEKKGVCPRNGQPCEDIVRLKTLWPSFEDFKNKTENELSSLHTALKDVVEFQGGTKVYVAEIKQQISSLETKLFTFMGDLVKNLTSSSQSEEDRAAKERATNTKAWLDFAKFILGGTIFIIVAYFFGKGAK